ncbi:hypothetical protein C2G38_2216409 [Gigaspora rosea]|uniref:Uncharacterized protein n=1 Tax=Gigaspora rosea TaxID=44941 RepID=A0A397U964_9GLOM|nr:hypothetical protein C2G38_2216409 [Gigaspora rosea]
MPPKIIFYTKNGINLAKVNNDDQYIDKLKNKSNNIFALMSQGKAYLVISKYKETYEVFTRLLKIESENITLKYHKEINYIIERYKESISDLKKLLKINPDNT